MNMSGRNYLAWIAVAEAEAADANLKQRQHAANMRALQNPIEYYTENRFVKLYRLSKRAFTDLCTLLEEHTDLKSTQRVSLEEKILCALLFFAKGDYQCVVGEANNFSQETISVYVEEVSSALTHPAILRRFLKFPTSQDERASVRQRFYTLHGIPGVLGCIDGCHFKIFKPKYDIEGMFYCRKHYHSLNVQMVCDADGRILTVNPKFGGASHDAFIWENSDINTHMQALQSSNEQNWLLGDSGYPQRPWLMTPYRDPQTPTQEAFNNRHSKARVIIENTFGRLKNRWRCCIKDRALHYKPPKCAKIITACCVLHNICLYYNVPDPEDVEEGEVFIRREIAEEDIDSQLLLGRALRDQLARRITHPTTSYSY